MNPSLLLIPDRYKAAKLYSQIPDSGAGDLTFARNSNATRVNSAGLIEKVRTNLILNSATFATQTITVDANPHTVSFTGTGTMVITGVATVTLVGTGVNDRVSLSFTTTAGSLILTGTGTITLAQLETGDIATDYIATTTAAVSVGITADIPRLDYTGGGCPSLLLEPQRTNLLHYSEQFDNAAWSKQTGVTILPNHAISPDGYQNADLFFSTTGTNKRFFQTDTISSGASFTSSIFAKASGKDFIFFVDIDNSQNVVWFNLSNGTFSTPAIGTAKIEDYGNGWYRCSLTTTSSGTTGFAFYGVSNASESTTFTENGNDGVLFWGAQLEAGSYVSSYIPTLGSSVTRLADAALKETISSLLGSEGTIYFETTYYPETNTGGGERFVYLQGSSGTTFIRLWQDLVSGQQRFRYLVRTDDVQQANLQTLVPVSTTIPSRIKWASVFENNRFVTYINGVKLHEQLSGTAPSLQEVKLNNTAQTIMPLSVFAFYQEPFTDAQLATLTTL
jgi:hypothetical protein